MSDPALLRALHARDPIAARSPLMVGFFGRIMQRAMSSDFRRVRVRLPGAPQVPVDRPLVIFTNHPSWWDPAFFAVLSTLVFRDRAGYGPIDVEALAKYRFMARIGLFGVEPEGRRGAARFLRTSLAILADARSLLWITPEGRFADPRERPVRLRPGLAHLARRAPHAILVPMAMEYVFWEERRPEALCRFGRPIDAGDHRPLGVGGWTALLQQTLTETMNELAEDAIARDPERFRVLLSGARGVGGVYDLWRRARAGLRGETFQADHGRL